MQYITGKHLKLLFHAHYFQSVFTMTATECISGRAFLITPTAFTTQVQASFLGTRDLLCSFHNKQQQQLKISKWFCEQSSRKWEQLFGSQNAELSVP